MATVGIRLLCFCTILMDVYREAQAAYRDARGIENTEFASSGRMALVSVRVSDVLIAGDHVSDGGLDPTSCQDIGVSLKVSRLKVLDLVDKISLVPAEPILSKILAAPRNWHQEWHREVDSMRLSAWENYPSTLNSSLVNVVASGPVEGHPERIVVKPSMAEILYGHWNHTFAGDPSGKPADFSGMDLCRVDLSRPKLVAIYNEWITAGRVKSRPAPHRNLKEQ